MPDEPNWLETPAHLYLLIKDAGAQTVALRRALFGLPLEVRQQVDRVYYHPYEKYAHVVLYGHHLPAWDVTEASLAPLCPAVLTDGEPPARRYSEPWVLVKAGAGVLRPVAQALNFLPNPVNRLFGGPSPLAATLSGGLVGAGLGSGVG